MQIKTHHPQAFRTSSIDSRPLEQAKLEKLLAQEWATYKNSTIGSGIENELAHQVIPLGVPSSFQHWDPYPISIVSAQGAWMKDVDGRDLLDLSMGFGAMLAGHLNPEVVAELKKTLEGGT